MNRSEKAKAGPKCDCWKYERQVCDVCQRVTGREKDKVVRESGQRQRKGKG